MSFWKDHHVVEDESGALWNANDSDNRRAGRESCPNATWSIATFLNTTAKMICDSQYPLAPDGRSVRSGAVRSATIIIIIIIIIIILIYSRLSVIRWRSTGKSVSQQEIKAISLSTYRMLCAVLISVSFCSSVAHA